MKKSITFLAIAALILSGCSDSPSETEITIQQEGRPDYAIRITIEGKKEVVIADPYGEEINALSSEFAAERSRFMKDHENMTPEERKAYGQRRSQTAARIRELQKKRKSYIREQMEKHEGVTFRLEGSGQGDATEGVKDYFDSFGN